MSWTMVKLGDVCTINPRLPKDVDPMQEVTFLAMAAVSEKGKISSQETRILHETKKGFTYFERGDVLLAKITPCFENGKATLTNNLNTQIGFGSTEFHVLRAIPELILTEYVFYLIWNERFRIAAAKEMTGSAGQKRVSVDYLKEYQFYLPSISEQEKIVAALNKGYSIHRKREQSIKLADDFVRAKFQDMFGNPVENPNGWKEKPLVSLIIGKLQNGAYYPKDKYSKDGVEMVHMADAFYDVIQRGSLKRVLASDHDIDKYKLTHEDIMISRRSLNYEGAAKPSLIPQSDEPLIFESSMIRITPDKKQIDKLFLFYYLTDPLVKEHFIRKFVTGATIKGINQKNLEQVRIIVPPLELQKEFSYIVRTLEKHKKKLNESEILSIELFTAISQRAFLGQL